MQHQSSITNSTNMDEERYPDWLGYPVTLIGTGGIGSTLAALFARAGVRQLILWDYDKVEAKNLQMQNFDETDIGRLKVSVVRKRILAINSKIDVVMQARKFTNFDVLDGLVVSAVDSIESRTAIFEAVQKQKERVSLFVDGRLTRKGDFLEVYCIDPNSDEETEYYKASLFDPGKALKSPRADCMTAHVPYMLSGLIGKALADWAEGGCYPCKVTYDAKVQHIERYLVRGKTGGPLQ